MALDRGRVRRVIDRFLAVALVLISAAAAVAAMGVVGVEDWHAQPLGATGIPRGWLELPVLERLLIRLGTLTIVEDQGQRALRLTTDGAQHTIIRKKITADLGVAPMLEWRWKVLTFPTNADLRDRHRSDSPAVLALAWRQPARVVSYAWDVSEPVGSRFDNPKQPRVHYIVVRSGTEARGKWVGECRDVTADYRAVFGEEPATAPEEIEISVDSNDTRSVSDTLIGAIRFVAREPQGRCAG